MNKRLDTMCVIGFCAGLTMMITSLWSGSYIINVIAVGSDKWMYTPTFFTAWMVFMVGFGALAVSLICMAHKAGLED